ncbi:MAG: NAD(P)/FAD-dependent oxidoreductase, partial [Acidobacteria bacterium]|nr:NAD(P)/FAD-dependent oxidoreductase [Acidobacteriota bacterium]
MRTSVDFLIIGSGFGGLGMAVEISRHELGSYAIVERESSLGGTWRDNTYPGAACDVKATLYHFSFTPWRWSRAYPQQPEILSYMEDLADDFEIRSRIHFNQEVSSADWDDTQHRWRVRCTGGAEFDARYLIAATGQLHRPRTPHFPGAETFAGDQFH